MVKDKEVFETWEEVIVYFFENRISQSSLYKAKDYIQKKRNELKSEKDDKKIKSLGQKIDEKEKELLELRKNAPQNEIREWIDTNSQKKIESGKRILKATHVLKFTHSSASSDAFLLNEKSDDVLLSTASVKKELTLDMAHNNGALISLSRFLALQCNGTLIFDLIQQNNFCFLEAFKKTEKDLKQSMKGLSSLIEEREIKTFDKAKQIYFPIKDLASNSQYHLLSPLFSSSLEEEIKKALIDKKYLDSTKEVRKQRNGKKENQSLYHKIIYEKFINIAVQSFGGEHPKNVSMLNANRAGKAYLLSCVPPTWESKIKVPLHSESLFYAIPYNFYIQENVDYLRDFLLRFENLDLSVRDPRRMKHIKRWVENIIDEVFVYIATIQNLEAGWSKIDNIQLKKEHQALLDSYRSEDEFQTYFYSNEWQDEVCKDFAEWINKKLRGKKNRFTPQKEHTKLWKDLIKNELREFSNDLAFDVKQKLEEKK